MGSFAPMVMGSMPGIQQLLQQQYGQMSQVKPQPANAAMPQPAVNAGGVQEPNPTQGGPRPPVAPPQPPQPQPASPPQPASMPQPGPLPIPPSVQQLLGGGGGPGGQPQGNTQANPMAGAIQAGVQQAQAGQQIDLQALLMNPQLQAMLASSFGGLM